MSAQEKLFNLPLAIGIVALAVAGLFTFTKSFPASSDRSENLPDQVILPIPFSPQAPNDNWSRNEDCEETSITMANAFLSGNTSNTLESSEAQKSIDNLKIWEDANLGFNVDTGADATTRMAEGAFSLKVTQIAGFTEQDLKRELASGYPILLPINAKLIKGQQYRNEGPTYHMVVIRGYRNGKFIINDPGTERGNGNEFTFQDLHNAAADWDNHAQEMKPDRKIVLVLSK
ncbi:C39 family peptidase [bacterium]|nr:MAG: C39 family peptidase [bacterium]